MGVHRTIRWFKFLIWNVNKPRKVRREALLGFMAKMRPVRTEHPLIRLGGQYDGGYLVPDDLDGIVACFSPGVSSTADFESALVARGIKCFLADASVSAAPIRHDLIDFDPLYLGPKTEGEYITLTDWMAAKMPGVDDNCLLQMDIEGAEYPVLIETPPEVLKRFRIILVEFHTLGRLRDDLGFAYYTLAFAKLLKDFDVVHIHPNNVWRPIRYKGLSIPPLIEITFLRKDRSRQREPHTEFPHPLDRRNSRRRRDLILPACWQSQPKD